jgi:RNA polymerase sigma-70 factor, ECF subfamily
MDEGRAKACFGLKKETPAAFSAKAMENWNSGTANWGTEYSSMECSRYLENSDECLQRPPQVSVRTSQRSWDMVLIRRAQAGDAEAFGQMVTNYRTRIFSLIYDIVRNEHDACDLVQEVFLKAWQSIHRFENRSSLYTWLYRLAMNVTMCSLRRKGRCEEIELSDDIPSSLPCPGINCQRTEIRDRVTAAVARLSPKHRAVIELKELQGLQCHEIAETLNLPIGTVMSRLFAARKRLQSLLGAVYQACQQEQ